MSSISFFLSIPELFNILISKDQFIRELVDDKKGVILYLGDHKRNAKENELC